MARERREFIRKLLEWDRQAPRDLDSIASLLKDEKAARVRRLRSQAIVCLDDVAEFAKLLSMEFPDLVYFFANYKTDSPTPNKFPDDFPITLYPSLIEAVEAAIIVGESRPEFNGPNFNRPNIIARWPWPDELASYEPEQLIGGREFPDSTFDLAIQYRGLGRWFMLRYQTIGYYDPHLPYKSYGPPLLQFGTLPLEAYPKLEVLQGIGSEFFTLYDSNDDKAMAFAKRTHALWRRVATKDVALYDPITGEIVTPEEWPGRYHIPVGKRALEHGLLNPPSYAGFAFSHRDKKPKGPALMIGPKPKEPRRRRRNTDRDE